jgi:hypothetical protein
MLSRTFLVRAAGSAAARRLAGVALVAAAALPAVSCSETVRTGSSPVYLTITQLAGKSGDTGTGSTKLSSDVCIHPSNQPDVTSCSVVEDVGTVTMVVGRKDITAPLTTNNLVTVSRYRVVFVRADGRNTPGVDVPYPFDGGVTFTVGDSQTTASFVLVRAQAKLEPPLVNLANLGGSVAISTLAEVTFYGRDQVGNDVQVSGAISVNFADWADQGGNGGSEG